MNLKPIEVKNQFIFGTSVRFETHLDLETCRNKLLSLSTPITISTNVGLSKTQIYLKSIERKLNRKGEGYYIAFRVDAVLLPYFSGWHGYIMNFDGCIDQVDTVSVSGEISFHERFIVILTVQLILCLVLPILISVWAFLSSFNILAALSPLVLSLLWVGTLVLNLTPIMKCKNQLINTVYRILTSDNTILDNEPTVAQISTVQP